MSDKGLFDVQAFAETLLGFRQSCCRSFRLTARPYIEDSAAAGKVKRDGEGIGVHRRFEERAGLDSPGRVL